MILIPGYVLPHASVLSHPDRLEAFLPPQLHTLSLSRFLFAGDLKDGKNKADKKDHSSTGNDSKKTDGKSVLLVTVFIECAAAANVLALCQEGSRAANVSSHSTLNEASLP